MPETRVLLLKANPSLVVASMPVAGGGVLPRTFIAAKSVCVSSFDAGPLSLVFGALDFAFCDCEAWRQRAHMYGCGGTLGVDVLDAGIEGRTCGVERAGSADLAEMARSARDEEAIVLVRATRYNSSDGYCAMGLQ